MLDADQASGWLANVPDFSGRSLAPGPSRVTDTASPSTSTLLQTGLCLFCLHMQRTAHSKSTACVKAILSISPQESV